MPVYRYLDLSTEHITEAESVAIDQCFPAFEDAGPSVIAYDYGWWVNVQADKSFEHSMAEDYPNILACLDLARELDCTWINFDQDASTHDGLPTYEW